MAARRPVGFDATRADRATEAPLFGATRDGSRGSDVLAWEQIEEGRYMPRRIRGSLRGRELG